MTTFSSWRMANSLGLNMAMKINCFSWSTFISKSLISGWWLSNYWTLILILLDSEGELVNSLNIINEVYAAGLDIVDEEF